MSTSCEPDLVNIPLDADVCTTNAYSVHDIVVQFPNFYGAIVLNEPRWIGRTVFPS